MKRILFTLVITMLLGLIAAPIVRAADVELQPFVAQARRVAETLDHLGAPLNADEGATIAGARAIDDIQRILDRRCIAIVTINAESRVKVARGDAAPELLEQGWRTFLVKVENEAGVTSALRINSPSGGKLAGSPADQIADRWLQIEPYTKQPMAARLSGLGIEYCVLSLFSRDPGKREARLSFDVGQGTQDLGFRNDVDILFTARPAVPLNLAVKDENGQPVTASFVIHDSLNRVYPSPAKRLAPDFEFQPQVYRHDGESIRLPVGEYQIDVGRGPEYLIERRSIEIADGKPATAQFALHRWIDPSLMGWYSGDHHIHAAGCAHYTNPTQGVLPSDMMVHVLGEDLKVGCNLTWGPCFDYQKQFFTGAIDKASQFPYLLRYDVEVSGFGSHQSGHLVLLGLKQQIYPGGDSDTHWPKLGLNTLRWAKAQGEVCGPAHSGWGLEARTTQLPNTIVPQYSGIGANEYIVDVTHQVPGPDGKLVPAVDFMSTVDTPYVWELNMWYHTLNCGYRTRISGETDFPCIYGDRVGLGRSYVKLDKLNFDAWVDGIRQGRCYASDGFSHLIDFHVDQQNVGVNGSELRLDQATTVRVSAKVAARLNETPNEAIRSKPFDQQPYWNIERSRVGNTRQVPVEVIVNGLPAGKQLIEADGTMRDVAFDVKVDRSSWMAMRILPSSHTNPVFLIVGGKPIRASRDSAEWCLKGVDQCWSQKKRFIGANEMADATAAYDHARAEYRRIISECEN